MSQQTRRPLWLTVALFALTIGLLYPMVVGANGNIQLTFFSSSVITLPSPGISFIRPNHGPENEDTSVTIIGANFVAVPLVKLGTNHLLDVRVLNPSEIHATVPAGLAPGTYDVWVCNPDHQCASLPNGYTVVGDGPTLTGIAPAQGFNDAPTNVTIFGNNLHEDITITIGDTPLDGIEWDDDGEVEGVVPAGIPAGAYDVIAYNHDSAVAGVLSRGFTVLDSAGDDFYAEDRDIWTLPNTVRQGDTISLGVNVHRQGGKDTLQPVVAFYLGDPQQGGTLIGQASPPPMPPGPGIVDSTFVTWNTAGLSGAMEVYVVIDPDNLITETSEDNNTARSIIVVLSQAGDTTPPEVASLLINGGAVSTDNPDIALTIGATDSGGSGVASMYIVEREFNSSAREWVAIQQIGWIPFQTAYQMTLTGRGGVRYIQVWVADRAGNISEIICKARIDYMVPTETVLAGQTRMYRRDFGEGQYVTVRLETLSGDADLYVWSPDGTQRWVSNRSGTATDAVSFFAPQSGRYQIEVYGFEESEYRLTVNLSLTALAGEPELAALDLAKPERTEPIISPTNEPPGRIGMPVAPTQELHRVFMPVVGRGSQLHAQHRVYLPGVRR
jgi:hypothetical protein